MFFKAKVPSGGNLNSGPRALVIFKLNLTSFGALHGQVLGRIRDRLVQPYGL